jgi:hypothetical protein
MAAAERPLFYSEPKGRLKKAQNSSGSIINNNNNTKTTTSVS